MKNVKRWKRSFKTMVKRSGSPNPHLRTLIHTLQQQAREQGSALWERLAEDLNKPTRQRRVVNVYTLDKYAQTGETVVVPGKVLSLGELTKPLEVAAFSFSTEALRKINEKGKTLTITELLQKNPKGKNIRIMG